MTTPRELADRMEHPESYADYVSAMREAPAVLRALADQQERDAKDAARYRWLRHGDNDDLMIQRGPIASDFVYLPRNEKLDEMIDAARTAQEPKT